MDHIITKSDLRKTLRQARAEHAAQQPEAFRALLFHRPPSPLLARIADEAVIGLYHANGAEAPTAGYARFFHEAGHTIALPHFASADAAMDLRAHTDPHAETDLVPGPFGPLQPGSGATALVPDVIFVPLVGFTAQLDRLGQGGGHYDRWLAEHPGALAIGLAWDVQRVDWLPTEPHDIRLDYVVTPTRLFEPE